MGFQNEPCMDESTLSICQYVIFCMIMLSCFCTASCTLFFYFFLVVDDKVLSENCPKSTRSVPGRAFLSDVEMRSRRREPRVSPPRKSRQSQSTRCKSDWKSYKNNDSLVQLSEIVKEICMDIKHAEIIWPFKF